MAATSTGDRRLRAGLPAAWRVADKTSTGARGTTNGIATAWPPNRAPLVVVACLTECRAPAPDREGALAEVARRMAGRPWVPAS
jgi:beta-lactamase class A